MYKLSYFSLWRALLAICILSAHSTGSLWAQNKESKLEYELPESYYPSDSLIEQKLPVEELWWRSFNDPLLDSLMQSGMKNNWNLSIAHQRVLQARAVMRGAYGGFFPSFDLAAGWNRGRSSQNLTGQTLANDPYSSYFNATINMNWEIDVFGSVRNQVKTQKNNYRASKADYYASMVSVAASLGSAYINLRTSQRLLDVMASNIATQQEVVRITEARYNAGLASMLDVSQAKSTYYNTRAGIAAYETSENNYINTIAVLIGVIPDEIRQALQAPAPFPQTNKLVPVSIPAALLRQRPDIRAAEYQIAAQTGALGVARSEWFPSFFITGDIGVASKEMDKLFTKHSLIWQIQPVMKWTIFNGGERAAAVSSAKASLQSSVDSYNQTVLTALQEVDNAIMAYKNSVRETLELRSAASEAERSFELSLDLYKMGLSAFINVVNAQQSLLSYQTALVNSEGGSLLYLIQLYQALGGGWEGALP
ncbi:MAG: efflux transporter outer membrane subunit [Bacteroidales bacterium]